MGARKVNAKGDNSSVMPNSLRWKMSCEMGKNVDQVSNLVKKVKEGKNLPMILTTIL